jgi:hypothetical protein
MEWAPEVEAARDVGIGEGGRLERAGLQYEIDVIAAALTHRVESMASPGNRRCSRPQLYRSIGICSSLN